MIRVVKPAAPASLSNKGDDARQFHCDAYDASPSHYHDGIKTFKFRTGMYNGKSVKGALLKAQHGKCCYCESKTAPASFGDVEHFRPKGGYRQDESDSLHKPGYYWLAYEWDNLLMACQVCNQQFKQHFFPVRRPKSRAISHHDDVAKEEPLLIHPAKCNPALYLGFREEYSFAIRNNSIGQITIDVLGLNKNTALVEARRERLYRIQSLKAIRDLLRAKIDEGDTSPEFQSQLGELDAQLADVVLDSAEYAAMARAALMK